ncbi:TIGR02680 family protein [Cryobacterium sp. M23]|uniref:TIGR02680 family protein n=1 Tax=Cryobacterium sp. M23 TaxID=2048292 RepID=UPI000CE2EA6C|nr:TIGR02680 family protein [Cryobacterium sp. M23]
MNNAIVTDLAATARAPEFEDRFRLARAGIVNVHKFANVEFPCAGGRVVFRGPNGSGKSRGMDMLFPFLLTGDRRRMGSGSSGAVTVDSLMRVMLGKDSNRVGYVWAEYVNGDGDYRTVGAYFKYSRNTSTSDVHFFITGLRVGHELHLMDDTRHPLSRAQLGELVGPHNITQQSTEHGNRVAQELFGVTDDAGRARLAAAFGVMYNLRSPDFGAKYRAKDVTRLLTDSLPSMPDATIRSAGLSLDNLQDTREQQHDIEEASRHASETLKEYRGYVTTVLLSEAQGLTVAVASAEAAAAAEQNARDLEGAAQARWQQKTREASELKEQISDLSAQKSALEKSPAYKSALAFVDRRSMVAAFQGTAASELGSWWRLSAGVDAAVGRAMAAAGTAAETGDNLAEAVRAAGACAVDAGLSHTFPAVSVIVTSGPTRPVTVRRTVEDEPVDHVSGGTPAVTITPADLDTVTDKHTVLRTAANTKHGVAEARLETAQHLIHDERAVESLERDTLKAERAAHVARDAALAAATQAEAARDTLSVAWAGWARHPATGILFGDVDWAATNLASILADGTLPPVHELDGVAESVAADAFDRVAVTAQQVRDRRSAFTVEQKVLTADQDALVDHRTPTPERQPWVTVVDGPSFWETVDFRPGVPERTQDAVESALRASGILTATVTEDGVQPVIGELLVSARGTAAARPLSEILTADPAAPGVAQILDRLGFNDPAHPVSVHEDGSWRTGLLAGRSPVTPARHIGATAQERARVTQLEQISIRLGELADLLIVCDIDAASAAALRTAMRAQVSAAPTAAAVIRADAANSSAATAADALWSAAVAASAESLLARTAWDDREAVHRRACQHSGLPATEPALRGCVQQLRTTVGSCDTAIALTGTLTRQLRAFEAATGAAGAAITAADSQLLLAEQSGERWRAEAAVIRKLEATIGVSAEQVMAELGTVDAQLGTATTMKAKTDSEALEAATKRGAAVTVVDNASDRAVAMAENAADAAGHVHAILRLPGVTDAVSVAGTPDQAAPAELLAWLRASIARQRTVSLDDVHAAVDTLRDHVTQMFDVHRTTTHGVLLVELTGGEGTHALPAAAADLARRAETGRQAIIQSEAEVFSRFIVDGVANDMRRVIRLARDTIRDTSELVSQHRTSNGIGVRLRFVGKDDVTDAVNRIRDLVAIPDQVRSAAENEELSTLLRQTVEDAYNVNRAEGYGKALTDSLDYRNWYIVEPIVLGPNDKQERTLKGAKLSEGELRYVTYLALMSALDSHLSALPPIAPRLILLDDAYAMVDDHGRRILTSILVERDIDFMMTGFDLWLHYANLDSLDEYEIRSTGEESPTTAVRYHWDGQRHRLREV